MCAVTRAHTHTQTCCILRSCSHPDSLAAAESRGLIGRLPCNGRFDWLSGRLPPCQLREHLCVRVRVCECVTVAANQNARCFLCLPLFMFLSSVFFFFISHFWIFSTWFSTYRQVMLLDVFAFNVIKANLRVHKIIGWNNKVEQKCKYLFGFAHLHDARQEVITPHINTIYLLFRRKYCSFNLLNKIHPDGRGIEPALNRL